MKLNNIILASCVLGCTLALTGCEKYDQLFEEQYHRVLNIKDSGIRNVTLYTTDAESPVPVSVMKTGSEGSISATGLLSPMTSESFTEYCKSKDLHYEYLPAEYYSIEGNLSFGENERYQIVESVMKTQEIKSLMDSNPGKSYALPLVLSSTDAMVNDSLLIIVPSILQPTVGFASSGYVEGMGFIPADQGSVTANVDIQQSIEDRWNLQCKVVSNQAAKERFEEFNSQNGGTYELLPETSYTLADDGLVTFTEGANTASLAVTVDGSELDFTKSYILPLSITEPSADGILINQSNGVLLFGVNPGKINLTVGQLSANSIHVGDGTGLVGLIDGLGAGLHFHANWGTPVKDETYGNYIQVALNNPLTKVKFDYWTRFENANSAPTHIKIFVSADGGTWSEIADISSGLPVTSGNEKYSSAVLTSPTAFTYFRFAVLQSKSGDMTTGNGSFFNLGELALYGN